MNYIATRAQQQLEIGIRCLNMLNRLETKIDIVRRAGDVNNNPKVTTWSVLNRISSLLPIASRSPHSTQQVVPGRLPSFTCSRPILVWPASYLPHLVSLLSAFILRDTSRCQVLKRYLLRREYPISVHNIPVSVCCSHLPQAHSCSGRARENVLSFAHNCMV